MNPKPENTASRIAEEARGRYARLVREARARTESAADRVTRGKKPVQTLTGMGLKLTAISHKTADKVLRQQTRLVEQQIDAIAGGLKAAAEAVDLRDLVGTQLRLIPQNASRMAGEARATLTIVAGAGSEIRAALAGTVAELRGKPRAARKKAVKKAAGKTAVRKTARKPARRKADKPATAKAPVAARDGESERSKAAA